MLNALHWNLLIFQEKCCSNDVSEKDQIDICESITNSNMTDKSLDKVKPERPTLKSRPSFVRDEIDMHYDE